jgi:hypothetical protein
MKETINFPTGYPYVLFRIKDEYVSACNEHQAIKLAKKTGKPVVANVVQIIESKGHAGANKLLKKFGDEWICKEGKIFYGKCNEVS